MRNLDSLRDYTLLGEILAGSQDEHQHLRFHALAETDPDLMRVYLEALETREAVEEACRVSHPPRRLSRVAAAIAALVLGGLLFFQLAGRSDHQEQLTVWHSLGSCQADATSGSAGMMSVCDLHDSEGVSIRLYPESVFQKIDSKDDRIVYELKAGHALFNSEKRKQTSIEIALAGARILLLGTTIELETAPGRVTVIEGAVLLRAKGCETAVEAGESAAIEGCVKSPADAKRREAITRNDFRSKESIPASALAADLMESGGLPLVDITLRSGRVISGISWEDGGNTFVLQPDGVQIQVSTAEILRIVPR